MLSKRFAADICVKRVVLVVHLSYFPCGSGVLEYQERSAFCFGFVYLVYHALCWRYRFELYQKMMSCGHFVQNPGLFDGESALSR